MFGWERERKGENERARKIDDESQVRCYIDSSAQQFSKKTKQKKKRKRKNQVKTGTTHSYTWIWFGFCCKCILFLFLRWQTHTRECFFSSVILHSLAFVLDISFSAIFLCSSFCAAFQYINAPFACHYSLSTNIYACVCVCVLRLSDAIDDLLNFYSSPPCFCKIDTALLFAKDFQFIFLFLFFLIRQFVWTLFFVSCHCG